MFTIIGQGPYCAVSYDSITFHDLYFFMEQLGHKLHRKEPDEFLLSAPDANFQYINLVTRFPLREKISQYLDSHSASRFSFFGSYIPQLKNIGPGVVVYPGVSIYPSTKIESDVIVHSKCLMSHNIIVGQNTFISGSVTIAGSVNVGKCCWIGLDALIVDNVSIANYTTINARSFVTKDIVDEHSTYKKHIKHTNYERDH
jgi:acetyltransferase-like isoleucine patch superfamily enzyme